METIKIYLSGSMSDSSWEEQSRWRKQIRNAIKYEDYDCEKKPTFFDPTQYYNFEEKRHETEYEVMQFDLHNLRNSNLVIVNFNKVDSIGTAMELMLAYELKIPIIGLNIDKKELHPWLECSCNRMFSNMRDLVDYVVEFYLN